MHQLTDDELHFEIRAALLQLDHSTIRDLGGDEKHRAAALDFAADVIKVRLGRFAIYPSAPDESVLMGEISTGPESPSSDNRAAQRSDVAMTAGVRKSGGRPTSVHVLDLSAHGFRLETNLYLETGNVVWLSLPGLEARKATVVWVRKNEAGCAFEEPLHEAVLKLVISKAREA